MEYKNVGTHAEDLADGRMFGVGETFELSDEDAKIERNADLIERGIIIPTDAEQSAAATPAAEAYAEEKDVPLTAITGTGADGQITKADVEAYVKTTEEASDGA